MSEHPAKLLGEILEEQALTEWSRLIGLPPGEIRPMLSYFERAEKELATYTGEELAAWVADQKGQVLKQAGWYLSPPQREAARTALELGRASPFGLALCSADVRRDCRLLHWLAFHCRPALISTKKG